MNRHLRKAIATAGLAALAAFAVALPAAAQSDAHEHDQGAPAARGPQGPGGPGMGMGPGMMGDQRMMMEMMMQNCRQMMQGGGMGMGARGLPRLPEGNDKLELQMHADMMKAMGDIMAKYAARLPEK